MNTDTYFQIPDHVIKNITVLYGDNGKNWISHLSEFISFYENEWNFKVKKCFSDAQFNIVLDVVQNDGVPAVFKCCFPNKEFKTEVLSLLHYDGYGAVKLLKSDIENGAMLLDRIKPGILLEKVESIEEATKQAITVCNKLHKPINDSSAFLTLKDWFKGFDRLYKKFNGTTGPFQKNVIEKAIFISNALLVHKANEMSV